MIKKKSVRIVKKLHKNDVCLSSKIKYLEKSKNFSNRSRRKQPEILENLPVKKKKLYNFVKRWGGVTKFSIKIGMSQGAVSLIFTKNCAITDNLAYKIIGAFPNNFKLKELKVMHLNEE